MATEIKFYSKGTEHGYMSNFAHYQIKIGRKVYKTSEHFYQSQKYKGTSWETKVKNAAGAMEAARLGRDKKGPLRKDWEQVKDNVMREAVEAKFRQHPELTQKLLETGDARLIEHTENDAYWADGGDGTGKNMLGVILMEVRSKLQKEAEIRKEAMKWKGLPDPVC